MVGISRTFRMRSSFIAIAVMAMVHGGAASAQDVDGTAKAQEPAQGEIVVTAQRRNERLENVPVAVVAVSGNDLESSGIQKFFDLGQIASGVQIARVGPYAQPSIRGVSAAIFGNGLENNVAVYVDGIYQSDSMAVNGDLVNLRSIEILKGPQGTLYGRNATGGAILVTTLAPSRDVFTGKVGFGYGKLNDRSIQGYLSGPLSDQVAFSVAGSARKNHGYIRDVAEFWSAPFESNTVRAKLEFRPADWATITAGFNYNMVSDARANTWAQIAHQNPAAFPPGSATERDTSSLNFRPIERQRTYEYNLTGKFDTGIGDLSAYLSYSTKNARLNYDFDGTKLDSSSADQRYPEKTYQASVDYAIDAVEGLDLVVGGNYFRDDFNTHTRRYANFTLTHESFVERRTTAYAAYLDATYQVADKLHLTGGVRYSHDRQKVASLVVFPTTIPTLAADSWSAKTFRAVARYEIGVRSNVYASFSQGFKSGTYNVLAGFTTPQSAAPVENEKINAYEVGFKTASGTWRFNAAAYYYDYKNLQVSLTAPVDPADPGKGITTLIGNAPKAEVYGAEADFQADVADGFSVRASISYTHGRYVSFPSASGTGLNPLTDRNVTPQVQDWSGLRMLRAPTWSGSFGASYDTQVAGGALNLTANASFSSDYIPTNASVFGPLAAAAISEQQRYVASGYAILNLSAAWTDPSDHYTLTLYVNNVGNKRYLTMYNGSAFGDYKFYADPRLYGFKFAYKF